MACERGCNTYVKIGTLRENIDVKYTFFFIKGKRFIYIVRALLRLINLDERLLNRDDVCC